jgi:hypothetical protein
MPAISFCDHCSCHYSGDILKELVEHGIVVIMYPPHTSQIFQVLDHLLLGRSKTAKKFRPHHCDVPAQLDHAMGVLRAYETATTNPTTPASREKTGFGYAQGGCASCLLLMKGKFAQSPNLQKFRRSITIRPSCQRAGDNINGLGPTKAISPGITSSFQESKGKQRYRVILSHCWGMYLRRRLLEIRTKQKRFLLMFFLGLYVTITNSTMPI